MGLRRHRRIALLTLLPAAVALLAAGGCAVQQNNTYPIDIFTEMHYSQSIRSQEPPRFDPAPDAVVVSSLGGSEGVLTVPAINVRPYDAAVAADLYAINCSACHGARGAGDGLAAAYITSPNSFWASSNGQPYEGPPNLLESRHALSQDEAYSIIYGGILVMPRFSDYLSEEEIRDLVAYMYDEDGGLGA